jgi:DNA-damage-inducible protein D
MIRNMPDPPKTDVFRFDDEGHCPFELMSRENGARFWYAREFMGMLGYTNFESFEKAVHKAIKACSSLSIPLISVITPVEREIEGATQRDYKLTRFGCYLVAINGDVTKPEVAAAQAYFITLAEAFRQHVQQAGNVERLLVRSDVSEREHSLSGIVKSAGIENYAFFQNAGYRGLYDMDLWRLREVKGVPSGRSPLDFMGKQELAANLFRLTETEAKISNDGVRGQRDLEHAARVVGQTVRETMIRLSGTRPEYLPPAQDIKEVQSGLKKTHKEFAKLDGKAKKKTIGS